MRNEQLNELATLMTDYYTTKKEQQVILLGDFNLTPWSSYYKKFDETMHKL
jgi:endonuclease/exonuclease/phosphatase (EEP) superfamily protein YafD